MKKRLLACIVSVCMVFSMMPMMVFADTRDTTTPWADRISALETAPEGYTVDESGNVTVSTAMGLAWFAKESQNNTFSKKTITLTADIDLHNYEWTPIGKFSGTFDGGNHTISNLKIDSYYMDYAGLFSKIQSGTIKNLKINNADIVAGGDVAVLCGNAFTGKIENVHITGMVKMYVHSFAGGITGTGYASIDNCSVIADDGSYIKTDSRSDGYWTLIGGIRGFSAEGNIVTTNCTVKNIKLIGNSAIGGISGSFYGGNTVKNCVAENCKIEAIGTSYHLGYLTGRVVNDNSKQLVLENCESINNTITDSTGKDIKNVIPYIAWGNNTINCVGFVVKNADGKYNNYAGFDDALAIALASNDKMIEVHGDMDSVIIDIDTAIKMKNNGVVFVMELPAYNRHPVLSEDAQQRYEFLSVSGKYYVIDKGTEPEYTAKLIKSGKTYYYATADEAIANASGTCEIYLKASTSKEKTIKFGDTITVISEAEGAVWTGAKAEDNCKIDVTQQDNKTLYKAVTDETLAACYIEKADSTKVYYPTLAYAFTVAETGDTVVITKDITLASSLIVGSGKEVKLDLNGKTLTSEATDAVTIIGQLTVTTSTAGGKIQHTGIDDVFYAKSGSNLVIEKGEFLTKGKCVVWNSKGTVNIKDCIFTSTGSYGAIYNNAGTVKIGDGKFTTNVEYQLIKVGGGAVTEITGGAFNQDPISFAPENENYETILTDGYYKVGKHKIISVADVEATCVSTGTKAHYTCEFCGKLYSDSEGTNEVTADSLVIAATGNHTYGNWTTVKAATCADKGTEKRVCSVCDKEETREVAATGKHILKDGKCTVCKAVDPDAPTHTPIDTTKPVEDVAVGVAKDDVKEAVKVVDDTAKSIVDAVEAGKTAEDLKNIVDKKVVDAIANVAAGSDVKVTTSVIAKSVEKNDVDKKTIALVAEGSDKSTVAQYLDLSVMVNVVVDGKVVETGEIKQLSKPITFTIAIPEELKTVKEGVTRTYYVIRVHGNEVTKIPTTVNADGTLSFETDRFSTYALAYEDTAKTTTTPKTGDTTNMLGWLALMAVAGAGAVVLRKKETNK